MAREGWVKGHVWRSRCSPWLCRWLVQVTGKATPHLSRICEWLVEMQKKNSLYAQRRATLTASESLMQVLWKCEDILNSSLWFKMTRKSKINSERRIYHIKHIHAEDALFIICSAFLSAAHPKAKHAAKSCILMIRGLPHFPGRWIWGHENDF